MKSAYGFKYGDVWILCLVLGLICGASVRAAQPEKEIDRLAKAYRAARTENERRSVCLAAIDAGVIAQGRSVAVVDALFGTSYARKLPPSRKLETGFVAFHPSASSGSEALQTASIGWYFAFEFDSEGKLENYYVSNAHQK